MRTALPPKECDIPGRDSLRIRDTTVQLWRDGVRIDTVPRDEITFEELRGMMRMALNLHFAIDTDVYALFRMKQAPHTQLRASVRMQMPGAMRHYAG